MSFHYDLNDSQPDHSSPLTKVVASGDLVKLRALLAEGIDPNGSDKESPPLNTAVLRKENNQVILELLKAGANPNGPGEIGNVCWASPLFSAASSGNMEALRLLLDNGAKIKQPDCSELRIEYLQIPIVEFLISRGLDLKATDKNGLNALHKALRPPDVPFEEPIEFLLSKGVPLNARDANGKTPLYYWKQPRQYEEEAWFSTWLFEVFTRENEHENQRQRRRKINELLLSSGALL
jgi:ankyrin repeat protein